MRFTLEQLKAEVAAGRMEPGVAERIEALYVKALAGAPDEPFETPADQQVRRVVRGFTPGQIIETDIRRAELPEYVTECRFHPLRRWAFDYAWPNERIALEMHGGVRGVGNDVCESCHQPRTGRHTRGEGFERDREKMNEAALLGWLVVEVTTRQVRSGKAIEFLKRAFEVKKRAQLLHS